ncbi:MAG: DUF1819 family protein [Oscillospiraceae bacterium]|nr:DUF1819 family protein [Oscillospiraceae bacterium]
MGEYSAGLMSQSFWFIEFKKIVIAYAEGKTDEQIKALCVNENWFGAVNSYRAKRMYGYIIKRVNAMDDKLKKIFVDADVSTQKLINLICIMKLDRLIFEFVYEVYRDKVILGDSELRTTDVGVFFVKKEAQSDEIALWKESTVKHLKSTYMNFLTEAGLITEKDGNKTVKTITPPLVDTALEMYLADNNAIAVLKAITGVN